MLLNLTLALILPIFMVNSNFQFITPIENVDTSHKYTKAELEKIAEEMRPTFEALIKQINEKLDADESVDLTLKDAKYSTDFSIEFKILILSLDRYYSTPNSKISCVRVDKDTLLLHIEVIKKEQTETNKLTV